MNENNFLPAQAGQIMRENGKICARVLRRVLEEVKPGIVTNHLEKIALREILKAGAKPSFQTVKNYPYATCLCVNDVVVHGLPSEEKLRNGDILGVDVGVYKNGCHSDASWTIVVGKQNQEMKRFLLAGEEALKVAIQIARTGNRVGQISQAIQEIIEKKYDYYCVRELTGHGVGRQLHENPVIPCFLRKGIEKTPLLNEGEFLAIEVIYTQKKTKLCYRDNDKWSIYTVDGCWSGLFEHTIVVTSRGGEILTE